MARGSFIIGWAMLLSACYGRPYPIVANFSSAEAHGLSCRELAVEAGRLAQLRAELEYASQPATGSIRAFFAELGIGAHYEALSALDQRQQGVSVAQQGWRCQDRYGPVGPYGMAPQAPVPPAVILPPDPPPVPKKAPNRSERSLYRF